MAGRRVQEPEWVPQPHERATMPGSPANPWHPVSRRVLFACISVLCGLTGGFGNAIITANLTNLQGSLGLYAYETQWLPVAYVATNVCANLLLIKFRQQFGLRRFAQVFLAGYALATAAHLFVHGFWSAVLVRGISGVTAAALSTLALLYMMQAMSPAWRLKGVVLAIGIPQLAVPIARLFPSTLLEANRWQTLYWFELGLALLSLAAVRLLPLPPSERFKAFEKLDFVTFALFAPGVAMLCAVLGLGRTLWWTSVPWIGYALIGALVLIPTAFFIEHLRRHPLLNTRWLGSADILRFALVATLVRVVLSEQSVGAVGLFTTLGLTNDQFHGLFTVILVATAAGTVVSAVTLNPLFLGKPILIALMLISVGALMDSYSNNLTRPQDMYLSQAMQAFAGAMFLGPALLIGLTRALQQGPTHFVSFSALYGMTQSLGGLLGSALIGTFQTVQEKIHSHAIVEHLTMIDPQVAQRVQAGGAAYGRVLGDPTLRSAEGAAILAQAATREANVLAYNDVFLLVSLIALATFIWASIHISRIRRENLARAGQARAAGQPSPAGQAPSAGQTA